VKIGGWETDLSLSKSSGLNWPARQLWYCR